MEQTLTYNRKSLITSFEKATEITQSVKIDTILEAKQIINHLIQILEIKDIKLIDDDDITPDFNKDNIKIRFIAINDKITNKVFIESIKVFNDYIFATNK